MNMRRKSTAGSVVDFPFINTLGFLAYFIYNCALYWSPVIRHQYALRNKGLTPTVAFNDIIFAGHATLISFILVTQYFLPSLWGLEKATGRRPSRTILGIFFGSFVAVSVIALVVSSMPPDADPKTAWAWLDVVYTMSYIKLVVTVIKYVPQLLHNFRNKSTKGWAIGGMLLDFIGGVLSIAQQAIDSYLQRDWSGITGNPVKFALGNVKTTTPKGTTNGQLS
ncbi:mitochondrial dynamin GTPase Msp1 [Diatrype stigma]|uniref:Mitochondrial dynamin GTPase Msp1 n=1 Tax=Diatrype stigma TaxID=117547 RepID=A0AAN9UQN8_9PEZI